VARASATLPRVIRDKSGNVITTREEAKRYVLRKLEQRPNAQAWKKAAKLSIEDADAEAIDKQLRFALFMEGALDLRE
jgi:hypothetical protein